MVGADISGCSESGQLVALDCLCFGAIESSSVLPSLSKQSSVDHFNFLWASKLKLEKEV
jgi:P2-related tail formation protein